MGPDLRQGDGGGVVKVGVNWLTFVKGTIWRWCDEAAKEFDVAAFRLPEFISGSRFCFAPWR
ncbi:hypothetical protein PCIT_b0443 [Pseudoalteromonas citrea]|uniref:Uncharacterized protein n=2 Tax=Pseudoalteromonas citrea TaxID=43655 RepID=A0AAD4AEF8_9GAMM|nr:hypothetical protein [Pseudoalteromonas citrea]KAF7764441.1 hypothetical protein PCIT_b0443 [Pseudoalteromonas citrea]